MDVDANATEWSRRRLILMFGGVIVFVALVISGLSYAVVTAFDPTGDSSPTATATRDVAVGPDGTRGTEYRDGVAAAPMLQANETDMEPAAPALDPSPSMLIDSPRSSGLAAVPSGFRRSPEGAAGQLAAIEIAALAPMSIRYARDVYDHWAAQPSGFERWEIAQSIQMFHQAAGTVDGDGSVSVTATPVGVQIKGTDGPDWVLACVQLDVTTTVEQQTRFGFGHCERMQWSQDRWTIGPGKPPAQAPSTWPGSDRSVEAGWLLWTETDDHE
ncbi:hypothetical protein [Aeromicrobium sp.]|uniref:hypothetical protein n=1 Tax=Aeromicrobium sp. TaxID=1871063 RepID=UPI001999015D|nr:hypothetical protein [Aeromicrobium sp.]MBC7632605.1 hypothetical protein [Aeromicrobium sp.]